MVIIFLNVKLEMIWTAILKKQILHFGDIVYRWPLSRICMYLEIWLRKIVHHNEFSQRFKNIELMTVSDVRLF